MPNSSDPAMPNEDLKHRQVFARAVLSYHAPTFLYSQIRKSIHLPSHSRHNMAFKSLVTKGFVEDMTPDVVREKTYRIIDREGLAIFAGLGNASPSIMLTESSPNAYDSLTEVQQAVAFTKMEAEIKTLHKYIEIINARQHAKFQKEEED